MLVLLEVALLVTVAVAAVPVAAIDTTEVAERVVIVEMADPGPILELVNPRLDKVGAVREDGTLRIKVVAVAVAELEYTAKAQMALI